MKVLIPIIAIFFIASIVSSSAENVQCECTIANVVWLKFGRTRTCTVKSKLNIVQENTTITSITGSCEPSTPNPDVRFFSVVAKTVYYIPKGLDVVFTNLTGMRFELTKMKHVTKENLKPFPSLVMFWCVGNKVQFLEKDLFIHNTKLEFISFRLNDITYIDSTIFNSIKTQITHLYLDGTEIPCGLTAAATNRAAIAVIDKIAGSECGKIYNAPPLYSLWLNSQESNGNECDDELATCESECDAKIEDARKESEGICNCMLDPSLPTCPQGRTIKKNDTI